MNPAINGPKTGPLNGQKAIKAMGGPTSELMNMSLTVPPEMERKAEPAKPVMNLKIRWTAVSSSSGMISFEDHAGKTLCGLQPGDSPILFAKATGILNNKKTR
jgi:hypothetical protein